MRYIKIYGQQVPVTEEVYKEYYKMDRRRRYLEEDVKVGPIDIYPKIGRPIYIPSKEDSIERLMENGKALKEIEEILKVATIKVCYYIRCKGIEKSRTPYAV